MLAGVEDFLLDGLLDLRAVGVGERLDPAGTLPDLEEPASTSTLTKVAAGSAVSTMTSAFQRVTSMARSWPTLAPSPLRVVLTWSWPDPGPSMYLPSPISMAAGYAASPPLAPGAPARRTDTDQRTPLAAHRIGLAARRAYFLTLLEPRRDNRTLALTRPVGQLLSP